MAPWVFDAAAAIFTALAARTGSLTTVGTSVGSLLRGTSVLNASVAVPLLEEADETPAQGRRLWTPPAGCFVVNGGKLLVVKHWDGKFDIPGGMPNWNDGPPSNTAVRETFEETGYRVTAGGLLRVQPNGYQIYSCSLAKPTPEGQPDPHEIQAVQWFLKTDVAASGPWRFPGESGVYQTWY